MPNRKLLTRGLIVALACPLPALAQSSVTVTGYFKMSVEQLKLGNTAKTPSGETRVADNSSRIYFRIVEDLGGGLSAIGQLELRPTLDTGALAATGADWVGLRSARLGSLKLGRVDLHYNNEPSNIRARSGSFKASPISLLAFAGGGGSAIANNSRTANVVLYESPSWNGFAVAAAYSSNPTAAEADIGSAARKGHAFNLAPVYAASNWKVGYSYWRAKADVVPVPAGFAVSQTTGLITATPATATIANQRSDRLYGAYRWRGFEVGLAWDNSKIENGSTGARTSARKAWSVPLQYAWGPHTVYAHYTRARDDSMTAGKDGAKMWAVAYNYDLSKRTAIGLSYARISNDAAAVYNLDGSAGANGSPSGAVLAGEKPRLWAFTLYHAF